MPASRNRHAVCVSKLSETDQKRLRSYLEELIKLAPDLVEHRLLVRVAGYGNVASYVRAAPGAKRLVAVLGKESFDLFSSLLAVGFRAYDDHNRSDLNGAQRTGRVSLELLEEVPPIGAVMLAAAVLCPEQYDKITADAFTDRNPLVRGIANIIVKLGGKPFQRWSSQPSFIDVF